MNKTLCQEEFTNCEIVKENQRLKEVIEEVKEYIKNTYDDVITAFTEDKPLTNFKARKELLQILDKEKN